MGKAWGGLSSGDGGEDLLSIAVVTVAVTEASHSFPQFANDFRP